MGDFGKSIHYGGIYSKTQHIETYQSSGYPLTRIEPSRSSGTQYIENLLSDQWEKIKERLNILIPRIKQHISKKQEIYLPVFIAVAILVLVFASKTAFSKGSGAQNNLPISDNYKIRLIGTSLASPNGKLCSEENKGEFEARQEMLNDAEIMLKNDIASIVRNTPMEAMTESISQKPRPVAAFIVGIAMKESKFGIYSPKSGGRDCYNYWGFKGGGKTVAGGYTCFSSPEEAVDAVGNRIERMVAKGVKSPAQAISWKCGSTCSGHDPSGVKKWISDVGINFYKIVNS